MTTLLAVAALGAVAVGATWAALAVAARRLRPGHLRDLVAALPRAVVGLRRLARHPGVPRRVKVVLALAVLWVLSPVDLVPEVVPVLGAVDDVVVVVLAVRWAARRVPAAVLDEAWPDHAVLIGGLPGCNTCGDGSATPPPG